MNILVTGCAGFIGFHTSLRFINNQKGDKIFGIDNLNRYYDINLKKNRLSILRKHNNFSFKKIDICEKEKLRKYIVSNKIRKIIHLAAQAGVRYSITNPDNYIKSNIIGFYNILEICKEIKIKHLVFSSTSSVYGNSKKLSFKETDNTNKPVSLYAATKKSNEVIAYSYSQLYDVPITILRLFTVYGPYGRPDMALFKFVDSINKNKKVDLFNKGNHYRDFTYIDDVTKVVLLCANKEIKKRNYFKIFNVASASPKKITTFLKVIEKQMNKKSKINFLKFQKGDVYKTSGNISELKKYIGYRPNTKIFSGIEKYIDWYKNYIK